MRRLCGLCYICNESSRPNLYLVRFVETNDNVTRVMAVLVFENGHCSLVIVHLKSFILLGRIGNSVNLSARSVLRRD